MNDLYILTPLGALLLCAFFYLRSIDRGQALWLFSWSFVCIYMSGVLVNIESAPEALKIAGGVLNLLFVGLALGGMLAFAGRDVPRWLVPATFGLALTRGLLAALGAPVPGFLLSIGLSLPLFSATGLLVWRNARVTRAPISELLLGPVFAVLGLVNTIDQTLEMLDLDHGPMLVVWASIVTTMGLLQLLAVYERVRERDDRGARALENERRTLRAVLETAPLEIFLRDPDQRVTMLNRAGAARLGLTDHPDPLSVATERLDASARLLDDTGRLEAMLEHAAEDPSFVVEDVEFTVQGAEELTILMSSSSAVSETGELLGRVWITHDISEQRKLEAQLRRAQKMETLGTLAGGFAHDFNNQLTTILGNARLALEETQPGHPELREPLEDLEHAAEHCAELTRGLLAFARKAPMKPQPVRVEAVVLEVGRMLRSMLPSSVTLELKMAEDLWPALADPTQLQQVLLNLAINARDAVEGTGQVSLRVRNRSFQPQPFGTSSDVRPGRFVEFEIRDDGVGIDAETRERMFEPFFTTKEVGSGTGLGLSVVYGVVRSHDGWVEVKSLPGEGTRIRVYFPAAEGAEALRAATPSRPARGGHETVLLAEDDERVRRLARGLLEGLGYRVLEAADGIEAVEVFHANAESIDVALLDLTMPGRDGLEALDEIRRARPELPAILASGFVDAPERLRSRLGVRLLPKPFRADSLGRLLRDVLEGRTGP